jgi:hypothetical protein
MIVLDVGCERTIFVLFSSYIVSHVRSLNAMHSVSIQNDILYSNKLQFIAHSVSSVSFTRNILI